MKIDADTSLDEILKSSDVVEITTSTYDSINSVILSRVQALYNCMKSPAFSSEVDGQEPLSKAADTISVKYSNFLSELDSNFSTIKIASQNKEYEELTTLKECIITEKDKLQTDINYKNEQLKSDPYDGKEEIDAKIRDAIDINSKKIAEYEETLEKIEERLKNLDVDISASTTSSNSNTNSQNSSCVNEIPNFELDAFDNPLTPPADFVIDASHEISIPGYGEIHTNFKGDVEFHYDETTHRYFFAEKGEDWANYDYENSYCYVYPVDIKNSYVIE